MNSFSSYEVKLVYAYIFISLYNFAISFIYNVHNIISLGPEYIKTLLHYMQYI